MIKIGIQSDAYITKDDYVEGFKRAKEDGFDCLDFQDLADRNGLFYKLNDEDFKNKLTAIKKEGEKNGITFSQIHSLWPHSLSDKLEDNIAETERDIPTYIKSLKGAMILGAKCVVVHLPMFYGWNDLEHTEETVKLDREFVEKLLPYAEKYGVYICLENLPFYSFLSNCVNLANFVKEINNPYLKICLDTGHANVFKDDIKKDILTCGELLYCLHVHDNKRSDDHLTPYEGTINWDLLLSCLKEIKYKGCFSLETTVRKDLPSPLREKKEKFLAELARSMADKIE